jgi:hypothetical protein
MLCENSNAGVSGQAFVVEQLGRQTFYLVAMLQKLFLPIGTATLVRESVHCSATDLALDDDAAVQHREAHGHSVGVIAHRLAALERHRNISPVPALKMRRSAEEINQRTTIIPSAAAITPNGILNSHRKSALQPGKLGCKKGSYRNAPGAATDRGRVKCGRLQIPLSNDKRWNAT